MLLSALDISRMSFTSPSRNFEEVSIFARQSAVSGGLSLPWARRVMPIMPLSGVRMSWLMRDRNSDFAAFAAFACSMASASSAFFFCIASDSCSWYWVSRKALTFPAVSRWVAQTERYSSSSSSRVATFSRPSHMASDSQSSGLLFLKSCACFTMT